MSDAKGRALPGSLSELSREMGLTDAGPSRQMCASSEELPFDTLGCGKPCGSSKPYKIIRVDRPIYTPPIPMCAPLFSDLIEAASSYWLSRANSLEVDSSGLTHFSRRTLWYRFTMSRIHQNWREIYETELANGSTEDRAKHFAEVTALFIVLEKDRLISLDDKETMHFIRNFDQSRLVGSRWNELIAAIGSEEVLLISGNDYDLCHVIDHGPEEVFQRRKEQLISSELGLKDTCLRLSGIRHMIMCLRELDEDSNVRKFILGEIHLRIHAAFGKIYCDESDEDECESEDEDEVEDVATCMDCSLRLMQGMK